MKSEATCRSSQCLKSEGEGGGAVEGAGEERDRAVEREEQRSRREVEREERLKEKRSSGGSQICLWGYFFGTYGFFY